MAKKKVWVKVKSPVKIDDVAHAKDATLKVEEDLLESFPNLFEAYDPEAEKESEPPADDQADATDTTPESDEAGE